MWDFPEVYPQFQDSTLNPACFSSTVPGLHAGEGAERNGVYTGCMCQNEGKAQTQTRFCVIICTPSQFLFWELQHSVPTQVWIRYKRDLLLYPLLGGSVSRPPPKLCLFSSLLLSVSCYHVSLYFTPTPTPTLSPGPSVHISHSRPQRLQCEETF